MAAVFCNTGLTKLLQTAVKTPLDTDETWELRLFSNDYTPTEGDEVSDYTEATNVGSAKTLNRSGWDDAAYASGKASIEYGSLQTFTATGSGSVYGYYITTASGASLIHAERFPDAPFALPTAGSEVKLTPSISFDN